MAPTSLLLKNGTVIVHEANDHAKAIKADVLVQGNKITKIEPDIEVSSDVECIDCTDKIVAPGFVDTHRHMYTIGLRGRHGDHLLTDYMVQGILQSSNYEPTDIFWGQLAGCMEAINAGTTTVVDHSHLNYSEEAPRAAIAATATSGLRSVYGYCFNIRVDSWSPLTANPSFIAPWAVNTLEKLSREAPFGDGRVTLGLAFDGWFLPKEVLVPLFDQISKMGIKHITTHHMPPPPGVPSSVETMEAYGLLTSSVLLSHANMLSPNDISLIKKRKAHISSTPSVELQMAMGTPACFDSQRDVQACSSLGLDCHNVTLASIPAEMRAALANARGTEHQKFLSAGKIPARAYKTVQEAYALGTIQGARAIGFEDHIGSLAVGKLADIIVLDALSPTMICGAQQDPVIAIVMHSTPADVLMTIVDGVVRKRDGKLEPVAVDHGAQAYAGTGRSSLRWADVVKPLLKSRNAIQGRLDQIDFVEAKRAAMKVFGYDESKIVESV
ncbi:hypothetical protein LTR10_018520 [Elasticomyces elasticus]|uniref:Amidohydrolase-related domain-containing protein n=1 Tax=Exophiala sideris TaxID=1016849 RepID=A0ABR0J1D2_9EURO|nr:hypothetical protein LTR10_018520 [Elasticomyces elasticus]KAK5023887.1 hypothetical protein LTS07_009012 [Exophiala sideris]KAK5030095.1 hypothetical protein LTR13_008408 [Exophiala sideris]KAK5053590.1 hypothetical protein LTR69_009235 [Exophiala sideris]KAK5179367.1 hypothetical protein LTR44_008205 [Eurotiomycetes sp. CCFEE 6388]